MAHAILPPTPRFIDHTGQRFGRWTVLRRVENIGRSVAWLCRCDCGSEKAISASSLRVGDSTSCGCLRVEVSAARRLLDLTGRRFGRLTVLGIVRPEGGGVRWRCLCDCGKESPAVATSDLNAGNTKSCGCLQRERTGDTSRRHGKTRTPEHKAWSGMIGRCYNSNAASYANYGGRGLTVCPRWRGSATAFMEDMGERPTPRHSLDRIDNSRGYDCGRCNDCMARGVAPNCRWATVAVQCRNRRSSVLLTHGGETLSATEWGERVGLSASTITQRLRAGWTTDNVIMTPRRSVGKPKSADADIVSQIAAFVGPLLAGRTRGAVNRILRAAVKKLVTPAPGLPPA